MQRIWEAASADIWLEHANAGRIYVHNHLQTYLALAVTWQVEWLMLKGQDIQFLVDCPGGDGTCVKIAKLLSTYAGRSTAHVTGVAWSAGLILAVACDRRTALPDANFMVHGSTLKDGGDEDEEDAVFLAARTNKPYDFWKPLLSDGKEHKFGVEEALEWGVIHEVIGGGG